MTDIAFSFNGSAIDRTSTLSSVWTVKDYEFEPLTASLGTKAIETLDAAVDVGNSHAAPMRGFRIAVMATLSGVTGATIEKKGLAAWDELTEAFNPRLGAVKLQAASVHGATSVSRHLWVEILEVPTFRALMFEPQGIGQSGYYEGDSGSANPGYIVYVVKGRTLFPYWQRASLLTDDTTPATAELAISGSTDSVTVNNPGVRWVGVKLTASSVSGTVSKVTLTNTTNSDVMVLGDASAVANSDYLDWFATDPRKITRTDTNVRLFRGKMRLSPGNNTIESVRTTGTGTYTIGLSWPSLHYSF